MNLLRGVVLQLGLTCPLKCTHCYVTAGPTAKQRMHMDCIRKVIQGYGEHAPSKRVLAITGGDPFAMPTELAFAISEARSISLPVYINTSAFFATSYDRALKVLQHYEGICHVEISVDSFHFDHISPDCCINAARAAEDLGIPTRFAVQDRDLRTAEPRVLRVLHTCPTVPLHSQFLAPVGRAQADQEARSTTLMYKGCEKLVTLVFDEYGECYPCCSSVLIGSRLTSPEAGSLSLGNIRATSFMTLYRRAVENRVLRSVAACGPSTLYHLWTGTAPADRHYCDTCIRLNANAEFRQYLEQVPDSVLKVLGS